MHKPLSPIRQVVFLALAALAMLAIAALASLYMAALSPAWGSL